VIGGTLVVDGNFSNSPCMINGGTLVGNGSLDRVFAYGSIWPGHASSGQLTCGTCDLSIHCRFTVELAGTQAGIDYNQLVVSQLLSFETTDPILDVRVVPGFVGAVGNQYTIIRNDGTNPVTLPSQTPGNIGFSGLAEGSVFTMSNGAAFRISYKGGDGNDVVLTQVAARPILNPPSVQADGNILISGIGSRGATYEVQAKTTLDAPSSWLVLGTALAQTDGSLSFVHTNAELSSPQLYYRLHAP
jgi:hypothetical protein